MASKIKFNYDVADESSGFLLWQVHMVWQRKIKAELDKLNITHTQFVLLSVLAWLRQSNDSVSQVDIATHSKTDRMMVSKMLRTLEVKGYVKRTDHKTDTRAKVISLTEDGEKIIQMAIIVVEDVDTRFFSLLDQNKDLFVNSLSALTKKLFKFV